MRHLLPDVQFWFAVAYVAAVCALLLVAEQVLVAALAAIGAFAALVVGVGVAWYVQGERDRAVRRFLIDFAERDSWNSVIREAAQDRLGAALPTWIT